MNTEGILTLPMFLLSDRSFDINVKCFFPDAQKTDTIYHWKCPAHNCTAEYIGKTNRSLKEFQTVEIKPPVPSETATFPHNTQKQNLRFHNNSQRQQHPTPWCKRSTSHSYQRTITQQTINTSYLLNLHLQ